MAAAPLVALLLISIESEQFLARASIMRKPSPRQVKKLSTLKASVAEKNVVGMNAIRRRNSLRSPSSAAKKARPNKNVTLDVKVLTKRALPFSTFKAFYSWLELNHDKKDELWVRYYKKNSGKQSIDWQTAVKAALCWGWIDSVVKSIDASSYVQRFTPRRPKSIWSKRNTDHVKTLIPQTVFTLRGSGD